MSPNDPHASGPPPPAGLLAHPAMAFLNRQAVLYEAQGWRESTPQLPDARLAIEYTLYLFTEWLRAHLQEVAAALAKELPDAQS